MARVAVGVQIADCHCLDTGALQRCDGCRERGPVEWCLDRAVGPHALRHTEPQRAWHELLGWWHAEIVAIFFEALAHLDDVAMAFRGEQTDLGALVLEQRVGGDGGAVHDAFGLCKKLGRRQVLELGETGQAGHHADRWIFRGGGDLRQHGAAGVIYCDQVGERAPDIDADFQHGRAAQRGMLPLPLREGVGGRGPGSRRCPRP